MVDIYQENSQIRSIGWSTWHIEWCTKYRYKIFYSIEYRNLCKIFLHEAAKRHKFTIFDCEVDLDHVHVVVSIPLTMTPSYAVKMLKGCSSRGLFKALPHLSRLYEKKHLWSPGKFVGSVGHITLEKAKEYLRAHHAKTNSLKESHIFKYGRMSIRI